MLRISVKSRQPDPYIQRVRKIVRIQLPDHTNRQRDPKRHELLGGIWNDMSRQRLLRREEKRRGPRTPTADKGRGRFQIGGNVRARSAVNKRQYKRGRNRCSSCVVKNRPVHRRSQSCALGIPTYNHHMSYIRMCSPLCQTPPGNEATHGALQPGSRQKQNTHDTLQNNGSALGNAFWR